MALSPLTFHEMNFIALPHFFCYVLYFNARYRRMEEKGLGDKMLKIGVLGLGSIAKLIYLSM